MQSLHLLRHAISQLFNNLGPALRISGLPMTLQLAALIGLAPAEMINGATTGAPLSSAGIDWPALIAALAISTIMTLWIAVAWHRFILNSEQPGLVPAFHGRAMLRYFLRGLLIALVVGLVAVALGMVVAAAAILLPWFWAKAAVILLTTLLVVVVVQRFSVSLPALALGETVSLSQGWNAMRGKTGVLLALALVGILWQWATGILLSAVPGAPKYAIFAVVTWLSTMGGLSVLTTLYGHYVQGRPLR